ncbi:colicin E3/pyocin S6 family cytotoxin [Pseudonocardia sediminis]|uniref:colicin E3/pyocin S6 family cytotoxin n=1 Tax=Pseudonocardia sediminis TaxID=1397368 RepID=UPI00102A45DC
MPDEVSHGLRPDDWPPPSPVPIPEGCYLKSGDVEYLGFVHGSQRWRSRDEPRLYTWDRQHGHIELFNKRGRHLGVLDAFTGAMIGPPVPGRRIDV